MNARVTSLTMEATSSRHCAAVSAPGRTLRRRFTSPSMYRSDSMTPCTMGASSSFTISSKPTATVVPSPSTVACTPSVVAATAAGRARRSREPASASVLRRSSCTVSATANNSGSLTDAVSPAPAPAPAPEPEPAVAPAPAPVVVAPSGLAPGLAHCSRGTVHPRCCT